MYSAGSYRFLSNSYTKGENSRGEVSQAGG